MGTALGGGQGSERERQLLCLLLALSSHIVLFWYVDLDFERGLSSNQTEVSVSLLDERVDQADFLAASSQRGAGSLDEARLLSITAAPQIFEPNPVPEARLLSGAVSTGSGADSSARSGARAPKLLVSTEAAEQRATPQQWEAGAESDFVQQMFELQTAISNIEARLAQDQQELSRQDDQLKRVTSTSSLAAHEAEYIQRWLDNVQVIANMNYPQAASERGIEGSLRLAVRINHRGEIISVKTLASSGHKVLDAAAHNIVRLAEPFPAFPAALRAQHAAIEIIRTWKFYRQSAALLPETTQK